VYAFDERERAEEARFAISEELRFKAMVHRDRQLGLWAAGLLGKTGEAAATYAREMVNTDIEPHGDDAVFRKVRSDFTQAALRLSDRQIKNQMQDLMVAALRQVRAE